MENNLANLWALIFLNRWPETACCCLQCGSQAVYQQSLKKKKSSITSFHSSFSVLQLAKWYTTSYPLAFSHSLCKHVSLYNHTGFRDKILHYTFRWHLVDALAARCSELFAKWQLWGCIGFDTGHPGAASSKPAGVGVCQPSAKTLKH